MGKRYTNRSAEKIYLKGKKEEIGTIREPAGTQDHLAYSDLVEKPLLLSVPDAARLLGVGKTFAWMLVNKGDLPSVRLGKRVLVPRAVVEQIARMEPYGQEGKGDGTREHKETPT